MEGKEKFKTWGDVFDEKTLRVIFKLESDGYFENLLGPISTGKESNVFLARTREKSYVCVKIYMINAADFRKMYNYIGNDPRFEGLQRKRRQIIYAWAQREYRNLIVAYENGVKVPKPIAVKENVLVMEFIGDKETAARKFKDSEPDDVNKFCKELVVDFIKLCNAGLIHGDLSEFNVLNYKNRPVIIDLSHSVKFDYPNARELFDRDVKNLKRYFNKINVKIDLDKELKKIKNEI